MATRYQQEEEGKFNALGQPRRQGMALKVIDGIERNPLTKGHGLGGDSPHQNTADQPRPARGRNRADAGHVHPGGGKGLINDTADLAQMRAGGNFGDNPAMALMLADLAGHDIGADRPVTADNRGRSLITACFDAENIIGHAVIPFPAGNDTGMRGQGCQLHQPVYFPLPKHGPLGKERHD